MIGNDIRFRGRGVVQDFVGALLHSDWVYIQVRSAVVLIQIVVLCLLVQIRCPEICDRNSQCFKKVSLYSITHLLTFSIYLVDDVCFTRYDDLNVNEYALLNSMINSAC